jgi:hypothetical protein
MREHRCPNSTTFPTIAGSPALTGDADRDLVITRYGRFVSQGLAWMAGTPLVRKRTTVLPIGGQVEIAETGVLGQAKVRGAGWMTACGTALDGLHVRIIDENGNNPAGGRVRRDSPDRQQPGRRLPDARRHAV